MSTPNINEIVSSYLARFPGEKDRLRQLVDFIANSKPDEFCVRTNSIGHITASALIVDPARSEVLQVKHKGLDRWLQPGGHIAPGETPINAALREVKEEVGIEASDLTSIYHDFDSRETPFDIDTHPIGPNNDKQEGRHFHHDFRYLFTYTGTAKGSLSSPEGLEYKWVPFEDLLQQTTFEPLVEKIRQALSFEFRTKRFYEAIVNLKDRTYPCAGAIVVLHIIPDCFYYLEAINHLWPIKAIIPKPKSIDTSTETRINSRFRLTRLTRETINAPNNELLSLMREETGDFILFDIGGYFSQIVAHWPPEILKRIKMIIEDTENGHQKYEALPEHPVPILSAARSPLKENEDFLVGQSVLFSADAVMRENGVLLQYIKCSVFGYGKIGKSIAFHLLQRGIKPAVFDTNPVRRLEAHNRLCSIPERNDIIMNSDIIFCATGNRCLDIADLRELKPGCCIFSVTSSDDEMDLRFMEGEYRELGSKGALFKFGNDRHFFYLNNSTQCRN